MGSGEEQQTPAKPSNTSSTQENPTPPPFPDWSSMQAYYGAGGTPPPFFASAVASPSPHPYMWGGQHPFIPPYGTPVPYPALYPPGAVYPHPSMAPVSIPNNTNNQELEGKNSDVKDRSSARKTKGNSSAGNGKVENGKAASGSGNDVASPSAESGSEGSSDASDESNNQEFSASKRGSFSQMLADGANAQNNAGGASIQSSVPGKAVVPVPATNLNFGMDLWGGSSVGGVKIRANVGVASAVGPTMVGREGLVPEHQWIQDERELKRQKRKQSNRESARRSRLRKQAECEELQRRVESLNAENHALRDELQKLSEECHKLTSENDSIKEELTRVCGPDAVATRRDKNSSQNGDANS